MSRTVNDFDTRLRLLARRHRRMYANGIVRRMDKNGLISAHPRRRMPRFPLKGMVILFAAALLYKSVLFASLGANGYAERVDALAQGNAIEKAGAWVMQADPLTQGLARMIDPVVSGY